jgi:hypothetical protein
MLLEHFPILHDPAPLAVLHGYHPFPDLPNQADTLTGHPAKNFGLPDRKYFAKTDYRVVHPVQNQKVFHDTTE